ncbi:SDR family oxidoreductase [Thalassovita mangrovi]|uniref:Glucose 1-dehydrogenase n=1 Tax=Thalassovita mangrovi TaxID=2692236 RepID=A0A6L8LIB3_9RHOB|nr:SDR family oxidoreductase [Thalassovita mangrovi]MYM55585.1 glucose 1-dehydrogenase [Thalassovita mangrovi]
MRLKGKSAIVTGGASGFGAGIARKFAAEGARVMVADLNIDLAQEVAGDIGGIAYHVDVSQNGSVANMAADAKAELGTPDILVNNAGITHLPTLMEDVSEADFDRVFAVNCKSVYLMARHFVPVMKQAGKGAILNVASTAGISPRPRLNWYNASKGWMITATKAMAVELAPAGIRVNAICPVAGETPLLPSFMGEDTPEMREKFLSTIPLGRFSTPEDMGNAACFLCSDEASMVTGVAMEVDGGRCI